MKCYKYYTKFETTKGDHYLWIDDDKVVCSYSLSSGDTIVLHALYVIPEERRKGLMTMMMNHFQSLNITDDVWLMVYWKNKYARNVYKKYGFEKSYSVKEDGATFHWMKKSKV